MDLLENSNPQVFQKSGSRLINPDDEDDAIYDEIDNREIFDAIKAIKGQFLNFRDHSQDLRLINRS